MADRFAAEVSGVDAAFAGEVETAGVSLGKFVTVLSEARRGSSVDDGSEDGFVESAAWPLPIGVAVDRGVDGAKSLLVLGDVFVLNPASWVEPPGCCCKTSSNDSDVSGWAGTLRVETPADAAGRKKEAADEEPTDVFI